MNALTAPLPAHVIAAELTPCHDAAFIAHTIATLTRGYWQAQSKAVSARYGRPCPTCNVAADQPCRTRGSRRVTDTHAARIRGDR